FLIEQAYTHDRLVNRASQAAHDLARAESADSAGGDEGSSGGDEIHHPTPLSSYLNSRQTLPTLLLTSGTNGRPEANSARAAKLSRYLRMPAGSHRSIDVDGEPYVLSAVARPNGGIALAAVPS